MSPPPSPTNKLQSKDLLSTLSGGTGETQSKEKTGTQISVQNSLTNKFHKYSKIIIELEREGQKPYFNYRNDYNPIQNIIEAQLKGLIQGGNFLGGIGNGDRSFNLPQNPLKDFEEAKFASKPHGLIGSYSANTHQGIQRNYNEDRVSIILNINRP